MTDEQIEKALKDRAYQLSYVDGDINKGYFITPKDKLSQETLSYIDRLKEACQSAIQSFTQMETLYKVKCTELECAKEQNEDMRGELMSLQAYIDNHEEVWKSNAKIDKAIVRNDTAKEILTDIGNWYDSDGFTKMKEYSIFQKLCERYGVKVR